MSDQASQGKHADARDRELLTTLPVYGQLPFVPERATGCDILTEDGRRILDLYGGHAVAALGYGHPRLVDAVSGQSSSKHFQHQGRRLTGVQAIAGDEAAMIIHEGDQVHAAVLPLEHEGKQIGLPKGVRLGPLE